MLFQTAQREEDIIIMTTDMLNDYGDKNTAEFCIALDLEYGRFLINYISSLKSK